MQRGVFSQHKSTGRSRSRPCLGATEGLGWVLAVGGGSRGCPEPKVSACSVPLVPCARLQPGDGFSGGTGDNLGQLAREMGNLDF